MFVKGNLWSRIVRYIYSKDDYRLNIKLNIYIST